MIMIPPGAAPTSFRREASQTTLPALAAHPWESVMLKFLRIAAQLALASVVILAAGAAAYPHGRRAVSSVSTSSTAAKASPVTSRAGHQA